jgi:WD40 repeat protein
MNDATPKLKKDPIKLGEPSFLFNNPASIISFVTNDMQPIFDFHTLREFSISDQYKLTKNTFISVIIGGFQDSSFRIYYTKQNQFSTHKFHKRLVTCLVYCPIDAILVVGSSDCRISVWKVNIESCPLVPPEPTLVLYGHHNQVTAVQVSGTLNIIVSADWNGMILVHHTGGRLITNHQ